MYKKPPIADPSGYYYTKSRRLSSHAKIRSGLLPASTAITAHGDYTDAWVRRQRLQHSGCLGLVAYRKVDETRDARLS